MAKVLEQIEQDIQTNESPEQRIELRKRFLVELISIVAFFISTEILLYTNVLMTYVSKSNLEEDWTLVDVAEEVMTLEMFCVATVGTGIAYTAFRSLHAVANRIK